MSMEVRSNHVGGHQLYGGTVRLRWNDNYSTTHIYRYLLMSEFVQSEELGRGLFTVICRLLFSSG